ncbi:RWD domain-containing protein 1-like [Hydractinia symbiolongicarpus]|uniref:RWD domain-containing protein 1-like n=1 Tax=Hydractinia symbiolongicarpus TaxID=13093 RepID=UPI00254F7BAD|nr:RWD domain-containing protein 1-like [Hydractinia symbiolongicarpus]XP_057307999.1 RWD domain-containing protein 1-like [Hydractinia symbiolongicarpus]
MDYKEEQTGEFEALEAIFSEELTVLTTDPYSFKVAIRCSNEDTRDEHKVVVFADLKFTYVDEYPDQKPIIEIENTSENLTEDRINALQSLLEEQAEENIGMVMIFTLVSTAQEQLNNIIEDIKQEIQDEKDRAKLEQQRLDEIKYKGTPVTLENFLAWKIKFDQEMIACGKRKQQDENKLKKLTGKQLFERDSTLNESDIQFISEAGVKVDESLFQDLDDLDLDEDFDE